MTSIFDLARVQQQVQQEATEKFGNTVGSEQQAAKEATAIASAASTVEPCDCNDKLLKKNQPAMTAITAMGLARSWPSKQKRWQKQGTSSSEARQQ